MDWAGWAVLGAAATAALSALLCMVSPAYHPSQLPLSLDRGAFPA
jgi:hypothetical protein